MSISNSLEQNKKYLSETLPLEQSFDIVQRDFYLGQTPAYWIGLNGLCDNEILQHIISDLQNYLFSKDDIIKHLETYMESRIAYVQAELCDSWQTALKNLLSGPCLLFVDGFDKCIILDTRSYTLRTTEEPDTEKVTRGARDGFIESLVSNTSLIRRRIRDTGLTFEKHIVGNQSQTDVAVGYLSQLAPPDIIQKVRDVLSNMDVSTLTMGTKSLEEMLVKKKWYHPLPCILTTERPDVACSYLSEGHVLIVVDNSPSVIILPCTIFQFTQAPEDYYKSIGVGNYIRFIRFVCIFISLLTMPVFMLLYSGLSWSRLVVYILLIELSLDLFKYSSAHAPSGFSGSLSIIGGLILSDSAIQLNWTSPEVIFYGAATMLASLSIAHIEFAEGIRLYRLFLILITGCFGILGFVIGLLLIMLSVIFTPTFAGRSYFWPLYPFNKNALKKLLFRYPTSKAQPINSKD